MKTSNKLFCCLSFALLLGTSAEAQFFKKLAKKAEKAAERTVERRVEQETSKKTDQKSLLTKKTGNKVWSNVRPPLISMSKEKSDELANKLNDQFGYSF